MAIKRIQQNRLSKVLSPENKDFYTVLINDMTADIQRTINEINEYKQRIKKYTETMPFEKWIHVNSIVVPQNRFMFMDYLVNMIQDDEFTGYTMTLNDDLDSILKKPTIPKI